MSQIHYDKNLKFRLRSQRSSLVSGTMYSLQVIAPTGQVLWAVDKAVTDWDLTQARDPEGLRNLSIEDLFMSMAKVLATDAIKEMDSQGSAAMPAPPLPHNPIPTPVGPKSTVPTPKERVMSAYPINTPILFRENVLVSRGKSTVWNSGVVTYLGRDHVEIRKDDDGVKFLLSYKQALYDLREPNCYPLETTPGVADADAVQAEYRAAHIARGEECPDCKGLGTIRLFTSDVPCDTCNGKGTI